MTRTLTGRRALAAGGLLALLASPAAHAVCTGTAPGQTCECPLEYGDIYCNVVNGWSWCGGTCQTEPTCGSGSVLDCDTCTCSPVPGCGNGVLEDAEQCDDGSLLPGDGCDAECKLEPEARRCQEAIAKAGRRFAARALKAVQRCRDGINRGRLLISPAGCPTEPKTQSALGKAGTAVRRLVAGRCTDALVAALAACGSTIDELATANGAAGCLISSHLAAVDAALAAEYGR